MMDAAALANRLPPLEVALIRHLRRDVGVLRELRCDGLRSLRLLDVVSWSGPDTDDDQPIGLTAFGCEVASALEQAGLIR